MSFMVHSADDYAEWILLLAGEAQSSGLGSMCVTQLVQYRPLFKAGKAQNDNVH